MLLVSAHTPGIASGAVWVPKSMNSKNAVKSSTRTALIIKFRVICTIFVLQCNNASYFMKTESIHDKQALEALEKLIVKKALILPQIDIFGSIFDM